MDALGFPAPLARAPGPAVEAVEAQRSRAEAAACEKASMQAWQRLGVAAPNGDGQSVLIPKNIKATDVKLLVRKGIPAVLRPAAWLQLSGGSALQAAAGEGHYRMLSSQTEGVSGAIIDAIDADARLVGINWRPHKIFTLARSTEAITRVLTALMRYSPHLGYSRHMCHMTAWVLVVYGGAAHEEAVFWTLAALLTEKLVTPTWPNTTNGAAGSLGGQWAAMCRVQQEVLERLLARKMSRLSARLEAAHTDLAPITMPWLASCYVSALPPDTLLRVWDSLLCEGPKVALRVALALLKSYETTLMACTAPDFMRKMLEVRVSRTTGAEQLMIVGFKGLGSLPGAVVNALRAEVLRSPPPVSALAVRRSHSPPDMQRLRPVSGEMATPPSGTSGLSPSSGGGRAVATASTTISKLRRVESARASTLPPPPAAGTSGRASATGHTLSGRPLGHSAAPSVMHRRTGSASSNMGLASSSGLAHGPGSVPRVGVASGGHSSKGWSSSAAGGSTASWLKRQLAQGGTGPTSVLTAH